MTHHRLAEIAAKVTRLFPPVWGAGVAAESIRRLALSGGRTAGMVRACVNGLEMTLSLSELTEAALFFYPQLYNRREIAFLKSVLRPGDTFVDVGANIGFFSLTLASQVGPLGSVIGIDADEYSCTRLELAAKENGIQNLRVALVAVGDREGRAELVIQGSGNRGNSSVRVMEGAEATQGNGIRCATLPTILEEFGATRVRAMKIDVEGAELNALDQLLSAGGQFFKPYALVVEDFRDRHFGALHRLLVSSGFQRVGGSAENGFYLSTSPAPLDSLH